MRPTSKCPGSRGSVIVVGAGPVGLAVVKECLAEGLDVQCFEQKDGVGGLFRTYGRNFFNSCPTVRLTSSPWITAYSDFPPNSSSSRHQTAQEYLDYLESYVEHFGFSDCLNFRKRVINAEPDEKNGWCLTIMDCDSGKIEHHRCDRLAICVGTHHNPNSIDLPGLDTFTGEVFHSSKCNSPSDFKGKSVVIIGGGESGVDIANQIADAGGKTYLSIQRGKLIIPRINPLTNMANDYDTSRIRNAPPIVLRNWLMTFKRRLCFHKGEHTPESALRAQLLEQSNAGPISQIATKSDDFIHALIEGKLELRKKVVKFEKNDVIFEDGIRHRADVVIIAYGYSPSFPFLKRPESLQACHPGNLYLNMFHPEIGDSLAFCGFIRPTIGAIPPTGELQARLFAQVAAGKCVLLEPEVMAQDIFRSQKENADSFPLQSQPNVVINWIPYMDKVASLIGCRPNSLRLLTQPRLLWKLCSGPVSGAHYRLHGPGASQASLETVMKLPRGHQMNEIFTYIGLYFWIWPITTILSKAKWRSSNTLI
ncbi:MAG: NAD(P)-binding domain-containing protein [Xenococcaceae cyanobacterium]